MKIEFTQIFTDNYELPMIALFNETVISEAEVQAWLGKGMFTVEIHPAIVIMTKNQYENLSDREQSKQSEKSTFYDDLRLEQHGGIV
jgi:hypothetical protein